MSISRAASRGAACARHRPVAPISRRVPDRLDIAAKRPISGFDLPLPFRSVALILAQGLQ